MAIHSVGGSGSGTIANMAAHLNTTNTQAVKSSDGDADDGSKAVKSTAPTVNLQGQALGKIVNTTA